MAIPSIKFKEDILKKCMIVFSILFLISFSTFFDNLYNHNKILEVNKKIHQIIKPNSKVFVVRNNFYYSAILHYDKNLISNKQCVVNDLFELKHTLIRYKNKNYIPDYVIAYGNINIQNNHFEKIADNNFVKLYRRN